MGVGEGNLQVIDIDVIDIDVVLGVIMEKCPIISSTRYILTSDDCGVCNSHYSLNLRQHV